MEGIKSGFADAKNMARVDIYKLRDGRLTDLGGLVLDFNRNYQDFKKGVSFMSAVLPGRCHF